MTNTSSKATCLSILGTGSDVGKSIVVTALCRIFSNQGMRVAPFKAQNMSNNSWVTADGGEMGRSQVVQAEAARVSPVVDMNPVLLKPASDVGAQVIVQGHPIGNQNARSYWKDTQALFTKACESMDRLRAEYDLIILEGAGSCAEVNLRSRDFVNFRMAQAADAPVILVADIDRGGVFAQIIGTLEVIPPEDRSQVKGIIINRFRGDMPLFDDGVEYLERRTGLPVFGVVPYHPHLRIDSEDSLPLDTKTDPHEPPDSDKISIAVLQWPRISNFTDFAPLERDPAVQLHYLVRPRSLAGYDLVLLPGTKNVRSDLDWLRYMHWEEKLYHYLEQDGRLGGICGGYQMLGGMIHDPDGIEGKPGDTPGLHMIDSVTTLHQKKTLTRSTGIWQANGETVEGYEIHMGQTVLPDDAVPAIRVIQQDRVEDSDGLMASGDRIWGTYFHGLFDRPGFRHAFLRSLKPDYTAPSDGASILDISAYRDQQYELLAQHFQAHLDIEKIMKLNDG